MMITEIEKTCLYHVLKSEEPSTVRTCAIVIQGPRHNIATPYAIKTYLTHNDDSVIIIVSTYLPENEMNGQLPIGTHLTENERESIKTGRLVYLFVKPPSPQEEPDFYDYNLQNQNLHILSTFVGVRYVLESNIANCLKVRSDVLLGRNNLCAELEEFKKSFPPPFQREDDRQNITERILFCTYLTKTEYIKGEDHVCDFWYYGRTIDIHKIFNIGNESGWRNGAGMGKHGIPECSIMKLWKYAIGLSPRPMSTIELTARYMIPVQPSFVQMIWYKVHPDFTEYERCKEKFSFALNNYPVLPITEWKGKFRQLQRESRSF